MTETIVCNRCKQGRSADQFHEKRGKIDRSWCKPCYSERYADRWANEPGFRERARERWLRLKYKITSERYDAILAEQGGGCAICGAKEPGSRGNYFPVDHNHSNGRVRGLLCHPCNSAIGLLKEDVAKLHAAITYLTLHDF